MAELISIIIALVIAIWVFQDARKRYRNKNLVAILWFLGVWGILIIFLPLYLIFRPKLAKKTKTVNLCPHCEKYYEGNPSFCPNCGTSLKSEKNKQI